MQSRNPSFVEPSDMPAALEPLEVEQPKQSVLTKKLKIGLFAVFLFIGAAGFAVGFFLAPREVIDGTVNTYNGANQIDDSVAMAESLESMYEKNPNLGKLSPTEIDELVKLYEADPDNWNDAMVPEQFVKLLSEAKHQEFGSTRRLGQQDRLNKYRELIKDFDEVLVKRAFSYTLQGFPNPVTSGDDKISVYKSGNECVIVSEESNSLEDWISNLDLGSEDIKSTKKYNQRDESCGCEKKTWWWCSTYKSCPVYTNIGSGFDGFVKPWNSMRLEVVSQINSKCAGVSQYVFAGYSRGGAILAIASAALKKEGIISPSKIKLVTFGAPRALSKGFSDETHADFETWRMVYKKDPVPSLPYGWMGFRHFGEMVCNNCGYPEERDRPNFSWITDAFDHAGYEGWLG